jgi:hypothetical protein
MNDMVLDRFMRLGAPRPCGKTIQRCDNIHKPQADLFQFRLSSSGSNIFIRYRIFEQ